MKSFGRLGRTSAALAVASALLVSAGTLTAWADNAVADGDGLAPLGSNDATFGAVLCGERQVKSIPVAISRNGNAGSTNVFKDGSTITVSVVSVSGSGLSSTLPGSTTIALPANWGTLSNNTMSSAVIASLGLTSTIAGAGTGSVTFRATGSNSSNQVIQRDDTMSVTWNAGACAPADTTPPVITPNVSGALGANGWYTSDVAMSWSVTDTESAVTSTTGCVTNAVTSDTNGVTFTCSATSSGGTSQQSVTIKRDATAPSISSSVAPVRAGSGWWNSSSGAPTAKFSCSDTTSGVASCEPDHTFGDGENQSKTGTVTDNAGNTATTDVTNIDVDLTAPTADADLTGNHGDDGWFVGDITVDWTVADSLSGPVTTSCPDTTVAADGTGDVTCTPEDNAGNTGTAVLKPYKKDATPPTITAALNKAADAVTGWFNIATEAPTVTYTCGDATSGLKSCTGPHTFGEGENLTATGTAKDNAGNTGTATVDDIDVDLTAPAVSHTLAGTLGNHDWYTSNVTIDWTVTDTGSGIATDCTDQTLSTDSSSHTFTCTATDNAGNTTTDTVTIKRDATKPVITWTTLINGGDSYYYGSVPASPACSATDVLSGIAEACAVSGFSGTVGGHTLLASATDSAGNMAAETRGYTVLSWTPRGFLRPVDMGTVWNTVKGGSTVPLKFEAFAGPTELTDVATTVGSYNVASITCSTLPASVEDPIETLASTGGTTMRYDWVDGQFIQNWQTPKKPGVCYQATVKFQDGSRLDAFFKLK